MDAWVWIVIIIGAVVVALGAVSAGIWTWRKQRSDRLRKRFGPEYDRLVALEGRQQAEEDLNARLRDQRRIVFRDIPPEQARGALDSLGNMQTSFVDAPITAVRDADHLIFEIMRERGYPLEGIDARAGALSVEHPQLAARYRDAHQDLVEAETATAPDVAKLHSAFLTYRELLPVVLGHADQPQSNAADQNEPSKRSAPSAA